MATIKIKTERVPYHEGYALYINNVKTHEGVFVSLKALKEFWNTYRWLLIAGYFRQFTVWKRANS